MTNVTDTHNRVFLSPSKNAFLLIALVSLECVFLEYGLLSWETQRRPDQDKEKKSASFKD